MKTFDAWYADLISDEIWYELLRAYKDETIKKAGERVYASLVAEGTLNYRPVGENRKHVYNICCKLPGDKVLKPLWHKKALEEVEEKLKKEEWKPVSWEKRAEYLNKVQEIIKGSTMMTAVPRETRTQQAAEAEGQWMPKKPAPYPMTTAQEAYVRQRHVEYIKRNYEPRTGAKLPEWTDEEIFNIQYDHEYDEALSKIKKTRNP